VLTLRGVSGALPGLILVCLTAAACGYSLRGNLPGHIKSVAIPVFANSTSVPAIESLITGAVVEAFTTNGRLRVVPRAQADATLEGDIIGYQLQPISFDPAANVTQYRLVVTLNLRFRDLRDNELLFEELNVQEQADFVVAGPVGQVATTIAREETAVRRAAIDIGRAVVNLAVDRF
jgi:outer membrane lipopolysaccharide assembly protein LptE/RlpB